MIKNSRKIIWAVLFIAVVSMGAFILIWLFRPGAKDSGYLIVDHEEKIVVEEESSRENEQEEFFKEVPLGMKEVNLPVSFYGDPEVLDKGDQVDIIATYYKEEMGSLCSERIIKSSEIIRLEAGGIQEFKDDAPLGNALIYDGISRTGTSIDIGKILVLTFFLTDDEVLRSFTALESGMLYVALCPDYKSVELENN